MGTHRLPGIVTTDRRFSVPLDHDRPDGPRISVFAREVVAADKAGRELPWLLFLQGGPGFGSPRPLGRDAWLDRALEDYRVLLLDQRGTARSTPANRRTLARVGDAGAQAEYLGHFRADSIVRDAELIRRELLGDEPWSVLGQSYGGFCTLTYLSFAPEGLREAFITGGVPGVDATADEVYRATYRTVTAKNAEYYARFPEDVERVRAIGRRLRDHDERLPDGSPLTLERFQAIGIMLGMSNGAGRMHYLVEDAFDDGPELTDAFLEQVAPLVSFASHPLNAYLHEGCYAQGPIATNWSAQRVRAEFPAFDVLDDDAPLLFTGEMIYPWMFEQDPSLRPLRGAAELLAAREDWPPLYDPARLRGNTVPVAAAVYHDDMYVDRELSLRTAALVPNLRTWITNEHEHDGLRVGPVLDRLIRMVRGEI
ncbi:alpha/beta fold hydrolase [Spirillospora sp. NPDC050679]